MGECEPHSSHHTSSSGLGARGSRNQGAPLDQSLRQPELPSGKKAAVYTSKIISQSALDILKNPGLVEGFWKDFTESRNARKMPPYEKCSFRI
ncbi:MAG: hypothetical protein ACLTW9_01100 [Enterocloster sp.]